MARPDLPTIESDSRVYWDGIRDEGVFRIVECLSCSRVHHYPRPFCPHCWSSDVVPVDASGEATLYTHSTVYVNDLAPFSAELPYIAAVVELAEGPRVMTRIVDCSPLELEIGMPLRMIVQKLTDEVSVPVFTPRR